MPLNRVMRKILIFIVGSLAFIGLITVVIYLILFLGLTKSKSIIDTTNRHLTDTTPNPTPAWTTTEEWQTLAVAIEKDQTAIERAAADAQINPRILVGPLISEQMRLFFTNREIFKEVFAPFRILGVQSQYSWGVMGMRRDSAIEIENNLKNPQSPFYLGPQYEHLLDFQTADQETERFARLTDQKNHYYSYLYSALFLKQIEKQWQAAGYNISNKPGVLATLFNIGFIHSKPNANPQIGGAEIEINSVKYSFGGIAEDFYHSNLLTTEFPK